MVQIEKIRAREIIDSRGNPTVEVEITSEDMFARAAAPSGASTGKHEALELRDNDARFGGKGVKKAVTNVNTRIARAFEGKNIASIEDADKIMLELDGTPNKSSLGANATTAVSLAFAKLLAGEADMPLYEYLGGSMLPVPMMNILNGGLHAGSGLAIQEFMVMPYGAKTFAESLRMGCEIYHVLGKSLIEKYGKSAKNVGDEGGFAPMVKNTHEALSIIQAAIDSAGYSGKAGIAMDAAASAFYDSKSKKYSIDGKSLDAAGLAQHYESLLGGFNIVSLEDPFDEEDFEGFAMFRKKHGSSVQVVGDDLLVTNIERIKIAAEKNSVNALLLKVNQVGTLSEAIKAAKFCYSRGWGVIVSHRSGETEDTTIADIAVGIESGQIKTGAPARSERVAKYNALLRIEENLGSKAKFAGRDFKSPLRSAK